LESELFGHVKGSFTGAFTNRIGRFEHADGGTIFLDEITELSLETQTKLLRVLQEHTIERVGCDRLIEVDVRIIASTNRNIRQCVAEGKFREDLFYRLNIINLEVPPLRERREDIPLLATQFVKEFSMLNNKTIDGLSADALVLIKNYHWPGNVRELKNCIEYACLFCNGATVTLEDLPSDIQIVKKEKNPSCFALENRITVQKIEATIKECNGNKTEAARRLRISRQTLYRSLVCKNNIGNGDNAIMMA
jgi:two-component system response regulator AtoC